MLSIVWTALVRWYWLNCWQIFSLKIFIWGYKFCKEHISPKFPKKLKPLSDIDLSHPKSPPHHPPLLAPGPDLCTVIWKYKSLSISQEFSRYISACHQIFGADNTDVSPTSLSNILRKCEFLSANSNPKILVPKAKSHFLAMVVQQSCLHQHREMGSKQVV